MFHVFLLTDTNTQAISKITWLLVFAASIGIYFVVKSFGVIPDKYLKLLVIVLTAFNLFMAIFAWLPAVNNLNKLIQSITCGVLAALLIVGVIVLPSYKGRLEKLFTPVPTEGTLNINAYVLRQNEGYRDVENLAGKRVGIQKDLDVEYQNFAIKVIKGNTV